MPSPAVAVAFLVLVLLFTMAVYLGPVIHDRIRQRDTPAIGGRHRAFPAPLPEPEEWDLLRYLHTEDVEWLTGHGWEDPRNTAQRRTPAMREGALRRSVAAELERQAAKIHAEVTLTIPQYLDRAERDIVRTYGVPSAVFESCTRGRPADLAPLPMLVGSGSAVPDSTGSTPDPTSPNFRLRGARVGR